MYTTLKAATPTECLREREKKRKRKKKKEREMREHKDTHCGPVSA